MPFDNAGTNYTPAVDFSADRDNGVPFSAARFMTQINDLADALDSLASRILTGAPSDLNSFAEAATAISGLQTLIAALQAADSTIAANLSAETLRATTAETSLSSSLSSLTSTVNALVAGAPGTLDTFLEAYNRFITDESAVTALTATVGGKLTAASNLSDLASAATARTNLGLGSLATASSVTASQISDASANGRSLIAAANYAAIKALLAIAAGDVSGLAAVATSGSASDLSAGTLPAARLPALTGDATSTAGSAALTLASTAVTPGSYGSASAVATFTVDAKGRLTAAGSTSISISAGSVSGLAAVATSGSAADLTGNLAVARLNGGTSASSSTFWRGDGTWATPAGGGNVSNVGTPTNGQIAEWTGSTTIQGVAVTGTGSVVRATSPTLVTPALGTPASGVLTNCTGLPIAGGGTGASDAATARTNLGLGSIATFAEGTAAEYQAGTASRALSADKVWSAASQVTLTDGATITPDFNAGINFVVTLGGNRTLANPTNVKAGQSGVILVKQDGTGSRTLSYGANYKWPSSTAPTLTTTASRTDKIYYYAESSTIIHVSCEKDSR